MIKINNISVLIVLFVMIIVSPAKINASTATDNFPAENLDTYVKYFYDRYSLHFDANGLIYSSPNYNIYTFKKPCTARELISLASYYKYRAQKGENLAKEILKQAVLKTLDEIKSRPAITQSFNDSEAFFIVTSLMQSVPELLTQTEKKAFLNLMVNYLPAGIMANDTENRAIIASAHWQYINNYLFQQGLININEKNNFDKLLKNKIDKGIDESIFENSGWYFEDQKNLSLRTIMPFQLLCS